MVLFFKVAFCDKFFDCHVFRWNKLYIMQMLSFFKNIDVPLVLFVLFFMFKQWVGLCPPDVQNYIPLCCGLLCGQSADVWHGNGFYESFIMPIASKDWVSIQC